MLKPLSPLKLFFFITLLLINPALADEQKEEDKLPVELFTINATGGKVQFQLEIANTPETRKKGLMFRKKLPRYRGLLIDYKKSTKAGIWMKNTLIPLDILFILPDGKIETIFSRAVPESKEVLKSKGNVRAVIELNAGITERFAIRPGDTVLHPIFNNAP
jgi:hypothetical protein